MLRNKIINTNSTTPEDVENDREAMLRDIDLLRGVLEMLNKKPIATWYFRDGNEGYYAGWDDAEYAVKKALTATEHYGKVERTAPFNQCTNTTNQPVTRT